MLLFLDPSGEEVDLIGGYSPPAENLHKKVLNTLRGVDTFKALAEQYAQGSRDVEMMTKLARKHYFKTGGQAKYLDLLEEIVSVDPEGTKGNTEYTGKALSCTQYAEFILAREEARINAASGEKPNPVPFQNFITKYPDSPLLKDAYAGLLSYYYYLPDRDEAVRFYEEITDKFPDDPDVLFYYVRWIIKDKQDLDHGIKLMERIADLTRIEANIKGDEDWYKQTLAELHLLNGDQKKAEEVFGEKQMQDKVTRLGYDLVNFSRFWTDRDKNLDTAAGMLEMALKLEPDNPYFRQSAADHYLKRDLPDRAHELYGSSYIARIENDGDSLRIYAAYWATKKENLDSALIAARKSVELTPRAIAWDSLAAVLFSLEKYEEALKAAEKAIELDGGANPRYERRLKEIKAAMEKK